MNEQEFEHWLARELQEPTDYIADDGFTAQLMAQLPAVKPRHAKKSNSLVLWAAIISSAIVAAILPLQGILSSFTAIFSQPLENWISLIVLGLVMVLVSTVVVWNDRVRLFDI